MFTGRRCGGIAVRSTPSSMMRPASGRTNPPIARSSVDLPEPDAPSSTNSSPGATDKIERIDRDHVAEAHAQAADTQQRDQCPALNRAHMRVRWRAAACGTGPMVKNVAICSGVGKMLVSASSSGRIIARLAGTALA